MLSPEETIGLEWLFCFLALLLLTARMGVRVHFRQYHLWLSDLLLIIGWLCIVGTCICDTLTYQDGKMLDYSTVSEKMGKIRLTEKYFFDVGLYFPKMSLVLSYDKMVPITKSKMRVALLGAAVFVAGSALAATFADTFWCGGNVSVNWSLKYGQKCTSFTNGRLQKVTWSLNIAAELLLFIFPFPILRSLRFTGRREKIGLALIFALGAITIAVSTGRFMFMLYLINDISLYVWTTVELSISVMVVSLMALRPLLRKVSKVVLSTLSTLSRSRSRGTTTNGTGKSKSLTPQVLTWGSGGKGADRPRHADTMPNVATVFSEWNVDVEAMTVTPCPASALGNTATCEVVPIEGS